MLFKLVQTVHSVVSDSLQPQDYIVHGILHATILEWVAFPFSREWLFPTHGSNPGLPHCQRILYKLRYQGSPKWKWKSLSRVRFFTALVDCTVHGILQARILACVVFPFSSGSFQPGIRPGSPSLQMESLKHWAIREALYIITIMLLFSGFPCSTSYTIPSTINPLTYYLFNSLII